jgi:hypothetical protein
MRGLSRADFWKWTAITFFASATFETVGIQGGAYEYWGPHAFRIFGYPLVIGVLETTFVMLFSVCADTFRRRVSSRAVLAGLFILFPVLFYGVNFGMGSPTLVTIGLATPSPLAVAVGSTASIAFAIWTLAALAEHVAGRAAASARMYTSSELANSNGWEPKAT